MSLLQEFEVQPSPQDGVIRIRRMLQHVFRQIDIALAEVQSVIAQHGRPAIDAFLGEDARQLSELYDDLKMLAKKHHPDMEIRELPK